MKELLLPMETSSLDQETYSHYIFHHRLDGLGTFIGEVLLSVDLFAQRYVYKDENEIRLQPRLFLNDMPEEERQSLIALREEHGRTDEIIRQTSWFCEEPIPAPEILWCPRKERRNLCGDLLRGLFHTAITRLVSVYEILIGDIAKEIYKNNHDLLAIEERQLTSAEIVELQTYDKVIESLIERAVSKLVHEITYPKLVDRFHRTFHVGIHDRESPVQLFAVHHLIEKRNIIVHNDGVASSTYVAKMQDYNDDSILEENDELPVDFVSFYDDLSMIRKLGSYIESCAQHRWPNLDLISLGGAA